MGKPEYPDWKHKKPPRAADHLKPYQFQPGHSGNPGGVPRKGGSRSIVAELRKVIDGDLIEGIFKDRDIARELVEVAVEKALEGNFNFFEMILERIDGPVLKEIFMASDHFEVTGDKRDDLLERRAALKRKLIGRGIIDDDEDDGNGNGSRPGA